MRIEGNEEEEYRKRMWTRGAEEDEEEKDISLEAAGPLAARPQWQGAALPLAARPPGAHDVPKAVRPLAARLPTCSVAAGLSSQME